MIDENLIIEIEAVEQEALDALEQGGVDDSEVVDSINHTLDSINEHMDPDRLSAAEQGRLMAYVTELETLRTKLGGMSYANNIGNSESIVSVIKDRLH